MVVAAVVAVANRDVVSFSLDPFSADPALAAKMPLFLLVFAGFGVGLLVGWIAAVWTRKPPPRTKPGKGLLLRRPGGTKPPPA